MLVEGCLSGELVSPAVPVVEDDLGKDEDAGFDLPFFCVGRLMAGAS